MFTTNFNARNFFFSPQTHKINNFHRTQKFSIIVVFPHLHVPLPLYTHVLLLHFLPQMITVIFQRNVKRQALKYYVKVLGLDGVFLKFFVEFSQQIHLFCCGEFKRKRLIIILRVSDCL